MYVNSWIWCHVSLHLALFFQIYGHVRLATGSPLLVPDLPALVGMVLVSMQPLSVCPVSGSCSYRSFYIVIFMLVHLLLCQMQLKFFSIDCLVAFIARRQTVEAVILCSCFITIQLVNWYFHLLFRFDDI